MNAARKDTEIPARRSKPSADEWTDATAPVENTAPAAMKKMSLHIPDDVHTEAKAGAARRRSSIVGEYIGLVQARAGLAPWPADVVESVLRQVIAEGRPWPAEVIDSVVHQLEAEFSQTEKTTETATTAEVVPPADSLPAGTAAESESGPVAGESGRTDTTEPESGSEAEADVEPVR